MFMLRGKSGTGVAPLGVTETAWAQDVRAGAGRGFRSPGIESGAGRRKTGDAGGENGQVDRLVSWVIGTVFPPGRAAGARVLFLLLLVLAAVPSVAAAGGAQWTVGRAVVETGPEGAVVKMSLRNRGRPDRDLVVIRGRWAGTGEMVVLGRLRKQVVLRLTAIVVLPLAPLGPRPGNAPLELEVRTSGEVTDRRVLR